MDNKGKFCVTCKWYRKPRFFGLVEAFCTNPKYMVTDYVTGETFTEGNVNYSRRMCGGKEYEE